MSAKYRIDLKTTAGVLIGSLGQEQGHGTPERSGFWSLAYTKAVNAPGRFSFSISGQHELIAALEENSQIEIWRGDPESGLAWTCDFYGLWRDQARRFTDHDVFTLYGPGQMQWLADRCVAWPAGVDGRSAFTNDPAETIMKAIVRHNLASDATVANGRLRDGAITGITVAADAGSGNSLDWRCFGDNVLETLQELAQVGGGDFDLVKTGAQAWEFRFYAGQRGIDRSGSVVFALERGNMRNPEYTRERTGAASVAIVGGRGEGQDRAFVVRTSSDFGAAHDVEVFVKGDEADTTAGYAAIGDARLEQLRIYEAFSFDVIQTPACRYGQHYTLGDLVTAQYSDVSRTQKVVAVTVRLEKDGTEVITPRFANA